MKLDLYTLYVGHVTTFVLMTTILLLIGLRYRQEQALRIWRLYLAGCAYAFARGWINLHQVFPPDAEKLMQLTVERGYDDFISFVGSSRNLEKLAVDKVGQGRVWTGTKALEFGLVDTPQGMRIYGGGILSSPKETLYALSDTPEHQAFDPLEAMRTPYRIDILQPLYFVLPNLKRLFDVAHEDIMAMVRQGMQLGLHAPKFPPKPKAA